MSIPELEECKSDFIGTLDADVKSLTDLHDQQHQGAGRPGKYLEALRRSAIVLLAANFENFCESLVCQSLSHLATQGVYARRYPERLRHWLFREDVHMKNFGIDAAKDFITLSLKLYSDVSPLKVGELKLERLKEEFSNPTPKNINWLVGLYDVDNYLDTVKVTVNSKEIESKAAINELAERRNKIAHGDATEKPTISDVKRLTKFCRLFANRLTKDITEYTEKCHN